MIDRWWQTKNGQVSTSFVQVQSAEVALDANHWRQTITTGNAVTVNYFDARWRKRLTTTYDAGNPGTTQRSQRFDYDPYNRTTFAAYPARFIGAITTSTPGTATSYDALGRPTQVQSDSELGTLTTSLQYQSGFQKRVTNPRGYATTTAYQAFDEPSEEAVVSIAAPEGLTVGIARDPFGKPLSITRSGSYGGAGVSATRSYVYDGNQLLCKTVEPEVGATVQALDAANNVAWRATGLSLTATNSCDGASVPAASKISFAYDARNRLTGTGFADGSASIGRGYTADGLLGSVVSGNSTWTYAYNSRGLQTQESLHESVLSCPDGLQAPEPPNAPRRGDAPQPVVGPPSRVIQSMPSIGGVAMQHVIKVLALSIGVFAGTAHAADTAGTQAGSTCDSQAVDKKLAGAAKTSFLKKCNTDMAAAAPNAAVCDSQAADRKLAGAAKASFVKKCQREAGVNPGVQCDAQAADKKLAGAAKASFLKKCVADAKG